ncbi:MAG TPA: cysteine desulfurase family protein [Bryobacteraceae bacterium]|nr:cysteine desulfurase family protein [Bryobacteraceae bacterium]
MLYFDHNATTPVAPEVADAFHAAVCDIWGNASSIHRSGQHAREALEHSRRTVAQFLGASANEIVFTSGGTESNNLAILGLVRNLPGTHRHVITSTIEHPAVLGPIEQLEREGIAVTRAGVQHDGVVDVDQVLQSIRPETVFISLMHANNEAGTLQPLRQVAAIARERGIFLHSDGVQAAGRIPVDVRELGVDLYSLSGHKFYAPKGVGALYVRKGTPLHGIQFGGQHERERRAGTENVAGAVALARATALPSIDVSSLRNSFESHIATELKDIQINGRTAPRVPNTSNVTFRRISGEAFVIALDILGMAVSTGSACSSGSTEPSHALLAMGLTREEARSTVRFSFGRYNTTEDVRKLADAVVATARRMRKQVLPEVSYA